jgi:alcohol dehydrogenase, propanol-preferring
MTRNDARDFLALAAQIDLQPHVRTFALERAADALNAIRSDEVDGAAVIVPN